MTIFVFFFYLWFFWFRPKPCLVYITLQLNPNISQKSLVKSGNGASRILWQILHEVGHSQDSWLFLWILLYQLMMITSLSLSFFVVNVSNCNGLQLNVVCSMCDRKWALWTLVTFLWNNFWCVISSVRILALTFIQLPRSMPNIQ